MRRPCTGYATWRQRLCVRACPRGLSAGLAARRAGVRACGRAGSISCVHAGSFVQPCASIKDKKQCCSSSERANSQNACIAGDYAGGAKCAAVEWLTAQSFSVQQAADSCEGSRCPPGPTHYTNTHKGMGAHSRTLMHHPCSFVPRGATRHACVRAAPASSLSPPSS